jgi:penicillin G amidase
MKRIGFVAALLLSSLFLYLMEIGVGDVPALGKLLHPGKGLVQALNEPEYFSIPDQVERHLLAPAQVGFDDRRVPYIKAENAIDLYFLQGYVTARARLWQMDFQTRFAAGRLSEIVGSKALALDMEQRLKGMTFASEQALMAFESDPEMKKVLDAYTRGVNAWIESLSYSDYPLEFKLLNYSPEPWTNFKSALMLKYMADLLTGTTYDMELGWVLRNLGVDYLEQWYPDHNPFPQAAIQPSAFLGSTEQPRSNIDFDRYLPWFKRPVPQDSTQGLGSNNWAVHGSKSETGKPLLANDPHLPLNLPSIWFEINLWDKDHRVHGASLPGTPAVIIGFTPAVAWGLTNGTVDVKDWFVLELNDKKNAYKVDSAWKELKFRPEVIGIKGQAPFHFKVPYTDFGPVVDSDTLILNKRYGLAYAWTGFEPSNELRTFYGLNRSRSMKDIEKALETFKCPPQNFVYADTAGNIGIWQKGYFPNRVPGYGRSLGKPISGRAPWLGSVPDSLSPHLRNPSNGFVFSANQHPFGSNSPYYYTGRFEIWRNVRIFERLSATNKANIKSMAELQLDNHSREASTLLPVMLDCLPSKSALAKELEKWNGNYTDSSQVALFFELWLKKSMVRVWPEIDDRFAVYPQSWLLLEALQPNGFTGFTMHVDSAQRQIYRQAVASAFYEAQKEYKPQAWFLARSTKMRHLARLEPFGSARIKNGGHGSAPNAMKTNNGPSWRMIVSLENKVWAQVIYPGGQSGNPASTYYLNQLGTWEQGKYHVVKMDSLPDFLQKWTFKPKSKP